MSVCFRGIVVSFSSAYALAFKTAQAVAGVSVTYARGSDTVAVTALVGDTRLEVADEYGGTTVVARVRDYIVKVSELVLDSVTVEPQAGDQISETRGSTTYVYEVMSAGADQPYRPSDRHGNTWRIHTKLIDET
tara:strand:- start:7 stop:408 length:402 start_codon:yes stop_codon:yes gene_type:complete